MFGSSQGGCFWVHSPCFLFHSKGSCLGPLRGVVSGSSITIAMQGPFLDPPEGTVFGPSQACAFWRWMNHVHADSSAPLLLLNMDETSVALKPTAHVGTVGRVVANQAPKAIAAASLAEMRARFTLMCTICADTQVQPLLPQILLSNGRTLGKKPKVDKLRGNLLVWNQKSAWACHATLRKYISLLGSRLSEAAPGREYVLLLDCAPSHLHTSIRRQAKLSHIRLVYLPSGLTRSLQPADTDLFARLKSRLSELYCLQQSRSVDGVIQPDKWLEILSSALCSVLPAVKWSKAFRKVGALNGQTEVCQALLTEFGWTSLPPIPSGPPSEEETKAIFPRRKNIDVMQYVLWKQPAKRPRLYKGKVIRTLD